MSGGKIFRAVLAGLLIAAALLWTAVWARATKERPRVLIADGAAREWLDIPAGARWGELRGETVVFLDHEGAELSGALWRVVLAD